MRGNLKSPSEFILGLLRQIFLKDLPRMHGFGDEFQRDFFTIEARVASEGLSFLTKTLPALGKVVDFALLGNPLCVPNFKKVGRTQLPAFMRVLFRKVFATDGTLLPEPCIVALNDIRQVTYLWYKLELPYEEHVVKEVLDRFVQCDSDLRSSREFPNQFCTADREILATGSSLVSAIFAGLSINDASFRPKHGPGAVATREKPWEKMNFSRYYRRLAEVFSYEENFFLSFLHLADCLDDFLSWEELESGSSKVVLVPKDSRGPRLIAMEPLEYQWIQQGIKDKLYRWIERHRLTSGRINFTDQTVNQSLALSSSVDGRYATLDLKDASDCVSLGLVETLFGNIPKSDLLPALLASRSESTQLPDGRVINLKKFAPMGSAVCFPVEAVVFWSLACSVLHKVCRMPLTLAVKSVYVYGDDLVVPTFAANAVREHMSHFDLRFNDRKCCTTGHFRESCGVEAFSGEDITPLKIRKFPPKAKTDGQSLTSWVSYSNTLWRKGFYSAATYCQELVESCFGGIPFGDFRMTGYPCPVFLCRVGSPTNSHLPRRYNKAYQRNELKAWVTRPVLRICSTDHWSEVFRLCLSGHAEARAGRYSIPRKVRTLQRYVTFECGVTHAPLCGR